MDWNDRYGYTVPFHLRPLAHLISDAYAPTISCFPKQIDLFEGICTMERLFYWSVTRESDVKTAAYACATEKLTVGCGRVLYEDQWSKTCLR